MSKNTQGNVLFLILIAVALFAALSYAVTKSTSGGGNANTEQTKLITTEILNYMGAMKIAAQRMQINGVADTDFCFDDPGWAQYDAIWGPQWYDGTPSCSDDENKIFHSSGGGVSFQSLPKGFENVNKYYKFTNHGSIIGVGTAESDLIFYIGAKVTEHPSFVTICNDINKEVGINYSTDLPPTDSLNITNWSFTESGAFATAGQANRILGDDNPLYAGRHFGCFREGHGGSVLVIYNVLIAR